MNYYIYAHKDDFNKLEPPKYQYRQSSKCAYSHQVPIIIFQPY